MYFELCIVEVAMYFEPSGIIVKMYFGLCTVNGKMHFEPCVVRWICTLNPVLSCFVLQAIEALEDKSKEIQDERNSIKEKFDQKVLCYKYDIVL